MVGGIGTSNISNFVLNPSGQIIVDVMSGESGGIDMYTVGTARIEGGTIFVRWNQKFKPTAGQQFTFMKGKQIVIVKNPTLEIESPGLPAPFKLALGQAPDRLFLEAMIPQERTPRSTRPDGKLTVGAVDPNARNPEPKPEPVQEVEDKPKSASKQAKVKPETTPAKPMPDPIEIDA